VVQRLVFLLSLKVLILKNIIICGPNAWAGQPKRQVSPCGARVQLYDLGKATLRQVSSREGAGLAHAKAKASQP
jgi:hypothetical protein